MNCRRALTLGAYAWIGAWHLDATLPWGRADDGFVAILAEANLSADQAPLDQLAVAPRVDAPCAQVLGRLYHRLESIPRRELERQATPATDRAASRLVWGQLVRVAGTIRRCERLEIEAAGRLPGGAEAFYRSLLETETGTWHLLSPTAPRAWRDGGGRSAHGDATSPDALAEPAEALGVFVGAAPDEARGGIEGRAAVMATTRVAWYPTQGVPAGIRWLSAQGVDASLWDDVRQRRGLAQEGAGGEAEAFYSCLGAVSRTSTRDMMKRAQQAIADSRAEWRRERDAVRAELAALRPPSGVSRKRDPSTETPPSATPPSATPPRETSRASSASAQLSNVERRAAFLDEGLRAAEAGRTAYAPLWEWPERHAGEFVVFEGTARRAVRVEVPQERRVQSDLWAQRSATLAGSDAPPAAAALADARSGNAPSGATPPADSPPAAATPAQTIPATYFEVDVYPADSRSLPVVCCVAALPSGFPQGDEIREPVRLAGIFFKSWRYRGLAVALSEDAGSRRRYAPLIFAATPQWLEVPRRGQVGWGLIGGVVFLAALAALWWTAARSARRDRQARRQFSGRTLS